MSGVGRSEGPTQPDGGGVGAGKSVGRVTRVGVRGVGRDREGRSVGRCFDLPRRIFVFSSEVRLTAEAQLRACKHTYTWRNNSNERHTRTVEFQVARLVLRAHTPQKGLPVREAHRSAARSATHSSRSVGRPESGRTAAPPAGWVGRSGDPTPNLLRRAARGGSVGRNYRVGNTPYGYSWVGRAIRRVYFQLRNAQRSPDQISTL